MKKALIIAILLSLTGPAAADRRLNRSLHQAVWRGDTEEVKRLIPLADLLEERVNALSELRMLGKERGSKQNRLQEARKVLQEKRTRLQTVQTQVQRYERLVQQVEAHRHEVEQLPQVQRQYEQLQAQVHRLGRPPLSITGLHADLQPALLRDGNPIPYMSFSLSEL